MAYLFTSESVSEGHPDKVADQISDALLDEFLRQDPESKVACETMVTTGLAICGGEVKTNGWVNTDEVVRRTIERIGYTKAEYRFDSNSCGIVSSIHEQSQDINQGVVRANIEDQGAGDQGMMFGYASREMHNFMPMPVEIAHMLVQELAAIRKEGKEMTYLRPDSKSQVTVEFDDHGKPLRIETIVVSTQHDEFAPDEVMHEQITSDVRNILIPRVKSLLPDHIQQIIGDDFKLFVNPTGKFVIGGPHGDTGLTGRKIIVDTYGGRGAHGGGAFSGKDASKVDRSAAYAARHIAKNLVAAGVADEILVQIAYAIGVAEPVGVYVNTHHTAKVKDQQGNILSDGEIARMITRIFDLRPYAIIKNLGLKNPIFIETAAYGHFGRDPFTREIEVKYQDDATYMREENGVTKIFKLADFFAWEKTDRVEDVKAAFNLA
ncbi:MAG: methionine adenosyltransferase [Bacteroidales bacterium]